MKCVHCGKEIADNSIFCPYCGGKQDQTGANAATAPQQAGDGNAQGASEAQNGAQSAGAQGTTAQGAANQSGKVGADAKAVFNKAKSSLPAGKPPVQMIVGIAVAVVLVLIVGIALTHRKTTVNLDKYVTISFNGYDTKGTASYDFDSDKFEKDYKKKLKLNKSAAKKWLKKNYSDEDIEDWFGDDWEDALNEVAGENGTSVIENVLDATIDPNENLSNGDEVTLSWDIDDEYLDLVQACYNCKLKMDDVTEKVDGLEEAKTFDPFDGASVSFSGIAPDGEVSEIQRGSDPACQDLYYEADKTDGLSNGDTVTVTVTVNGDDPTDYLLSEYGEIPSETSKEFKVSGLNSYVTSASQISDDVLKQMQSEAEDAFNEQIADMDDKSITVSNLQYIGNYLDTAKDGSHESNENLFYLVYKARVNLSFSNPDSEKKTSYNEDKDYYWYCEFSNLMVSEDGKVSVDLTNYSYPTSGWFSIGEGFKVNSGVEDPDHFNDEKVWTLYGYEKLDLLRNQTAESDTNNYNVEDNVKDVDFDGSSTSDEADTEDTAEEASTEAAED